MTGRGDDEHGHSPLEGLGAPRRGAHRTGSGLTAALTSLAAVVAVVALLGGLYLKFGHDDTSGPNDALAPVVPAGTATATAPGSTSPSPKVEISPAPTVSEEPVEGSPVPTPEESASADSGDGGAALPGSSDGPGAGDEAGLQAIPVVVLNQSGRPGAAARAASDLRAAGWTVSSVGNFRGTVPSTTVYYPAGGEAAAQVLAELLPGADRIRPSFSGVSSTKLTVVLV